MSTTRQVVGIDKLAVTLLPVISWQSEALPTPAIACLVPTFIAGNLALYAPNNEESENRTPHQHSTIYPVWKEPPMGACALQLTPYNKGSSPESVGRQVAFGRV